MKLEDEFSLPLVGRLGTKLKTLAIKEATLILEVKFAGLVVHMHLDLFPAAQLLWEVHLILVKAQHLLPEVDHPTPMVDHLIQVVALHIPQDRAAEVAVHHLRVPLLDQTPLLPKESGFGPRLKANGFGKISQPQLVPLEVTETVEAQTVVGSPMRMALKQEPNPSGQAFPAAAVTAIVGGHVLLMSLTRVAPDLETIIKAEAEVAMNKMATLNLVTLVIATLLMERIKGKVEETVNLAAVIQDGYCLTMEHMSEERHPGLLSLPMVESASLMRIWHKSKSS